MDDELLLNCKQLTNINISFCNKIIGNCFKELKELKHLNINYCYNVKEDYLNNLNNLESLNIIECKNIFGHCLQNLQQLQTLNMNVHSVTQLNILFHLINLKNLHIVFRIKDNNIKNLSFLNNLINLEKLYLKSFMFSIRDEDFYNLKKLKYLKIVNTKINLLEFKGKYVQYLTKLERLSCSVYFDVEYLNYLTNIKYLNLHVAKEHIYFNKEFSQFKNLEKLKLISKFEIIMDNDLTDLQLFTNLKHLKFHASTINGDFNNLPNLTTLELFEVKINDKQIMNLENLKKLTINNFHPITGECFLKFKKLKNLDIIDLYKMTFKYFSNLTSLTNLNISESEIEDKDLMELNNIQYLNVTYCPKLVSGTFLLNMNKLIQLNCLKETILNKIEIDKLKDEIKKGNNLTQATKCVLNKNY